MWSWLTCGGPAGLMGERRETFNLFRYPCVHFLATSLSSIAFPFSTPIQSLNYPWSVGPCFSMRCESSTCLRQSQVLTHLNVSIHESWVNPQIIRHYGNKREGNESRLRRDRSRLRMSKHNKGGN